MIAEALLKRPKSDERFNTAPSGTGDSGYSNVCAKRVTLLGSPPTIAARARPSFPPTVDPEATRELERKQGEVLALQQQVRGARC